MSPAKKQEGSSALEAKPDPSEDPTEETALSIVEDLEDLFPHHHHDGEEDQDCPIGEIIIELEATAHYEEQSGGQWHDKKDAKNHSSSSTSPPTAEGSSEKIHVGVLWLFIFLFLCSIYGFIWVMFNLGSKQPNS